MMEVTWNAMFALLSAAFAATSGFFLWRAFESWRMARRHKAALSRTSAAVGGGGAGASVGGVGARGTSVGSANVGGVGASVGINGNSAAPSTNTGPLTMARSGTSINDSILAFVRQTSLDVSLKRGMRLAPPGLSKGRWFDDHAIKAGITGDVTAEGFAESRARLAVIIGGIGFVLGLIFSTELALICAIVGAYLGWRAPAQAIVARIRWRAHETERHLPEMLDVIALGMRSGLSFDTSLRLYADHFDTVFSRELASAQRQWSSGLVRRDEALRRIAASYDSVVLGRVVETILRSIRYGSSMVQSLESDAAEARNAYQAERQERIAKAPVKMMIPTGVLILPAMLVMVLGPVLLELMGGGF